MSIAWIALCCCLIVFMHAGFALFETGLCRAKNATHIMALNLLVLPLSMLGFFLLGYGLLDGGSMGHWLVHLGDWGIVGGRGFALAGIGRDPQRLANFFWLMICMSIAATIPTGTLAERWRIKSFACFTVLAGAVVFPIFACWVWGGGWISYLGTTALGGHGGVDYAGSAVIQLQGGTVALVCAALLGPRLAKYDVRGRPRPILGHHVPNAILGTFILWFGWFGLNLARSIGADDGRMLLIAINTALASTGGVVAATAVMDWRFGKPDPSMMCNGLLAGLVASSASCAFVQPWAALLIGAVAGGLVVWSVIFWENRGIDDPIGVISVHAASGLWGALAVGLFADGTFGAGINGVDYTHGVTGLFYGNAHQLIDQCIMVVACVGWSGLAGGILFYLIGRLPGGNRVRRDIELSGLDVAEMGVAAYPEFINPAAGSPTSQFEPRPAMIPAAMGQLRYSMVIEGIDARALIDAWSSFCQATAQPPSDEFRAVYPHVTTVTGNRFRFSGGDPEKIRQNLVSLFQNYFGDKPIAVRMDV